MAHVFSVPRVSFLYLLFRVPLKVCMAFDIEKRIKYFTEREKERENEHRFKCNFAVLIHVVKDNTFLPCDVRDKSSLSQSALQADKRTHFDHVVHFSAKSQLYTTYGDENIVTKGVITLI